MRRNGGAQKKVRIMLWLLGALLALLVLAQIFLPRIAVSRIRSRVGRYGSVKSVSVTAWPAVKLLWGNVDSIKVHAGSLAVQPAQAAKLLWESHDVARMDVSVEHVRVGTLALSDAHLSKRNGALTAQAQAGASAVTAALPSGFSVQLLKSEGGKVEVQASGGFFGVGASVDALGEAREGKLVAHPLGFLVEGFQLTLFSDPHVYVEGVGAEVVRREPLTYRLSMSASLR